MIVKIFQLKSFDAELHRKKANFTPRASLDVTMEKEKEYDHPHYDDMVVETIRSQHKGKRGLSEKQILKHIMKTYDVDKARAPAEVKHSIKRLTKSGTIVHYQFRYKMPTHPDRKK